MLQDSLNQIERKDCHIEVFGLGYVGFPLSIRLAKSSFNVSGVDVDPQRIERLEKNILMESEVNLKNDFLQCRKDNKLILARAPSKQNKVKIGIISVPTPIPDQKTKSSVYVNAAIENFLETSKKGDIIIIESSIDIGTTDEMKELIESRGFKVGQDYGLCFCPERIDPQNKKWHLENIPRVIYCSDDITFKIAQNIYYHINGSKLVRVKSAKVAEVVKSFENTFRLVNISLVNELAILCEKIGINVKDVLDAASTKPFGFVTFHPSAGAGGHCIPKDPTFLLKSAEKYGFEFKTIENALRINSIIPKHICESIEGILTNLKLPKKILVCGLTYKADVEDMRDSPGFKIIKELKERNFDVAVYDPFFKSELIEKYCKENNLPAFNFERLNDLKDESVKKFSCICIVQHHSSTESRLTEIYVNSVVPIVYDCQNILVKDPASTSVLGLHGSKQ